MEWKLVTKTQWMEYRFEQAEHVDRQTVKMSDEELTKANNFTHLETVVEVTRGYAYGYKTYLVSAS